MNNPRDPTPATPADNAIYSDIPEIEQRLLAALPAVINAGFALEDSRPIPYGVRLTFRCGDAPVGLSVYYSRKKGHSTVVDAGTAPDVSARLRMLLDDDGTGTAFISPMPRERTFTRWLGCDEGGKGAFTGPLVAAAYLCDAAHARELHALSVTDSKSMDANRLKKLCDRLIRRYPKRISVLELKPDTYNRLYSDFKTQNKSLNHLLAWAHGKAAEKLLPAFPDAIIVDQFATPGIIRNRMPSGPELIIRTKAEDNIAVAAASVIASGRYLVALDVLSHELGITILPGAGADTDRSVRAAVAKHGPDILPKIVKLHFRNYSRVHTK